MPGCTDTGGDPDLLPLHAESDGRPEFVGFGVVQEQAAAFRSHDFRSLLSNLYQHRVDLKVKAYDEKGRSVFDRQGELVCEAAAHLCRLFLE
jgi:hypothetical protein